MVNETRKVTRRRPGVDSRGTGAVVCALSLAVGNLATGYLAMLTYAARPGGPWDDEAVAHSHIAAGSALALACVTALLTWVFVKAEWLRKGWFALPAGLALLAILRLTLLAPHL